MRLPSVLLFPALLSSSVFAIFADDAYHIDYHWALVGRPLRHATSFQQPFPGSKGSLIYTVSDKNVLAAINPKDGNVVWRQLLTPSSNSSLAFLAIAEGQDFGVSAVDGHVASWSLTDGRLGWEKSIGSSKIKDAEMLELEEGKVEGTPKDAIVLTEGDASIVRRLDGATGKTIWEHKDTRYVRTRLVCGVKLTLVAVGIRPFNSRPPEPMYSTSLTMVPFSEDIRPKSRLSAR